jgi:hypothetical protein
MELMARVSTHTDQNCKLCYPHGHLFGTQLWWRGTSPPPQSKPCTKVPYSREKGPMGGEPYIGSELGGAPILQVSVSQ